MVSDRDPGVEPAGETGLVLPAPDMSDWAEALVAQARADGIELTGEGGLLTGLIRQVLQTGLEVEMADHLGYDRYSPEGRGSGNVRKLVIASPVPSFVDGTEDTIDWVHDDIYFGGLYDPGGGDWVTNEVLKGVIGGSL